MFFTTTGNQRCLCLWLCLLILVTCWKLLFSCLCSKVTVYRFICWIGPKSCQIQPKPVNSLPGQTQACALFLNWQAKPSQARNPFFVIQAKPSRLDLAWLGLFLGDSKPAWWPLRYLSRQFGLFHCRLCLIIKFSLWILSLYLLSKVADLVL